MKKIYISPALLCVHVEPSATLAISTLYDSTKTVVSDDDIGTKDQGDWDEWDDWDE